MPHMADPVAPKSQPPLGKKRAIQRCPNCDIRCDVSLFVEGSLARCGHCGVRFEVHREGSVPPARQQTPAKPPRAAVAPEPPLPRLEGFIVLERVGQGGMAQVAHALTYAHARAVVHRDLKPDNVLVTKDLRTKVLDFGLAGLHAEGAQCLTQSNVAMGTANYMAPEQRKDAKRADHKADIYSFGVMTYELLTGELPVGKFPPPSKVVKGLDPRWDALIERCLESNPAGRPHSALELAHALEALAGMAKAMQLAPRTRKNTRKSGVWSWLGLTTAIAVVLGVAGLKVPQDHKSPRPSLARALAKKPGPRFR